MKHISTILLTILILVLLSAYSNAGAKITLATKGQTSYVIAIANDASATEKTAANELASYLRQITGVYFAVVSPGQAQYKPTIAVGPGASKIIMPSVKLDSKEMGDDGIIICTDGNNLILTGAINSRRGTIYAVYEFLEREIGVRWWTSTEGFTPSKSTLQIPELNIKYIPALPYRDILYQDMIGGGGTGTPPKNGRMQFAVRMKLDGSFAGISPDWGGNWNIVGWCHQFFALMPPDRYFAQHPEWYSEINGKRVWDGAQLCCTNESMIAELTKNVLERIRENPDAGIIDVSQNDTGGNCQCENCKKIDTAEGSASGSLLYCINKVAEAVDKVYPGYQVEFISYQYSRKPPKHMKPRKNVIVRLCVIERTSTQPIDSSVNKSLMNDLKIWKDVAPNLMLWDYTDQLSCSLIPHPNVNVFAPDFRTYVKYNVKGVFCEGDDWSLPIGDDEMKHYVMAHALWDPDIDTNKLINEFIDGYYGAAAPMIRKYVFNQIDRSSDARVWWSANINTPQGVDATYISLEDMNLYTRLFNDAQQRVQDDPVLLNRVKRMRLQVDHQWIAGYARYRKESSERKIAYLGPDNPIAAIDKLVVDAKALGVYGIAWGGPLNIDTYTEGARKYYTLYPGTTQAIPLPAPFSNTPEKNVIDVQEQAFDLDRVDRGDASLVSDPAASNKVAAFMNPNFANWAVQANNIEKYNVKGFWHAYAVVRVEKVKDKGIAFVGGVYNYSKKKSEFDLCVQLDPSDKPTTVDPSLAPGPLKGSSIDFRDGAYHVIDLGSYDIGKDNLSFWFGTTGGVSPDNVKGIYIDRVFFIKGK